VQEALVAHDSEEYRWLLGIARKLCHGVPSPEDTAQDLVQSAYVSYIKTYGRDEQIDPGKRRALLATIVGNRFIDLCRARKRQAEAQGFLDSDEPAAPPPDVVKPNWACVSTEQLGEAINTLSETLRHTYLLHAAGERNKDIAARLGLKDSTVAKRLFVARKQLFRDRKRFIN
jgi:RNA polymerase sigma factor (sigma-70 family)